MGLDMYLRAEMYLSEYEKDEQAIKKTIENIPAFNGLNVRKVIVDVGYWRKANAIHHWFVEHCQGGIDDCEEYYVSRDDLLALKEACQAVLSDISRAEMLLPTQSGFFFGQTDYGEDYIKDIEDTIAIIDKALLMDSEKWTMQYRSSW